MTKLLENAGLFAAGVLTFSLIEYVHHRDGGHFKKMGEEVFRSHQNHHLDPMEGGVSFPEKLRQRAPLVGKVGAAMGAVLTPVMGTRRAGWFLGGVVAGYTYSEWFHHTMHHRAPQNPTEEWLWRYHYIHHFRDSKVNYGFTSPLWDYAFGTARQDEEVTVPKSKIPESWPEESVPGIRVRGKKAA